MFGRRAGAERSFFISANEMFCASPGVTIGSGKTWIGRSLGPVSELTPCKAESPWILFTSLVSGVDPNAVNGWERYCAMITTEMQKASEAANRRANAIFVRPKPTSSPLLRWTGALLEVDEFANRGALARLKSDQTPDRGVGAERRRMRFLLPDELPLPSAQSLSARSPRWQKAPLKSFITLRDPIGRYARCRRKHRHRFYLLLADDSSDIARNHERRDRIDFEGESDIGLYLL
jgi:hypothetical protein